MTAATAKALTEIQLPSHSNGLPPLMLELAKCLKLVAPITMTADAQMVWLQAAVDALEDIRLDEVQSISAELRRSVTRPSQIVPEIAKLVSEKRQRANRATGPVSPFAAEMAINEESNKRRAKAHGNRRQMSEVYEWERQARIDAGIHVGPRPAPLSRDELEGMPSHIRTMGLNSGFLEYRGGVLVEAA